MYDKLKKYGLNEDFIKEASNYKKYFIARITEQHRGLYKVVGEKQEFMATVSGKFTYRSENSNRYPAVGDWVMVDREDDSKGNGVIHHMLTRKSVFSRVEAGPSQEEQIVATNIDTVFICMALNNDFNLRRLERYITVAYDSGATPVVILTKADLCEDMQAKYREVSDIAIGIDIVVCSALEEEGYLGIKPFIKEGETVAFIGSSGVGKSTLINRLLGEETLETKEVRQGDDRGKHTTTYRQLLLLPGGGIVIDTPGMRELQIYSGDLSKSFEDIEALASRCKFHNCSHKTEPGCKVKEALGSGTLSKERFDSYLKLQKEMLYDGLTSRQLEESKIKNMFGSKKEMKKLINHVKHKGKR